MIGLSLDVRKIECELTEFNDGLGVNISRKVASNCVGVKIRTLYRV